MSVIKAEYFQPKVDNPQSESDFDKVYFETSVDQVVGLTQQIENLSQTLQGEIQSGDSTLSDEIAGVADSVSGLSTRVDNIASELGATVVDSGRSSDGTIWYRKWSDGWLEQGGLTTANQTPVDVTYVKSYANTDYTIIVANQDLSASPTGGVNQSPFVYKKTVSGFGVGQYKTTNRKTEWYACGMGANE